jgi:uncharacterized membrane protein YhaH (DUF805 family)
MHTPAPLDAHHQKHGAIGVMTSATVSDVFFSLKGTLTRRDWSLAMLAAASLFLSGASSILGAGGHADEASARPIAMTPVLLMLVAFLSIAALLSAKRLLHCKRPVWLALTIPPPAILLACAYDAPADAWNSALVALAAYFTLFAVPAVLACAHPDPDE